jgi:predicted ATPase
MGAISMNPNRRLADDRSKVMDYHGVDTRVPFTGRAYELRVLLAFLKRGGALTLAGPGGVGKSRLALDALERHARESATETVFLPLAGVTPEAVHGIVLNRLGITPEPARAPLDTLVAHLREEPLILVLDSCEQAPDQTSALIDALRAIPGIAVIATSQRRLDYTDESVLEVEPFTIDEAMAFFAARAGLDPEKLDEASLATIREIVERLDGLAVAIDLAAARLNSLSLRGLAEELAELRPYHLRSTRGADPRHRTIGNVIAWSHTRLSDAAKRAFAQASVYADLFDEADLVALGDLSQNEVREALAELSRDSLIVTTEFGYRMLLPIRAVAGRMLADSRERSAFGEAFAKRINALASELWQQLRAGGRAAETIAILEMRYADLCATLAWALKRPADRLEGLDEVLSALMAIWADGGHVDEGLRWIERLEAVVSKVSPRMRGRIYYLELCVEHAAARYDRMLENGPRAITAFTIAGDQLGLARAYNALAIASFNAGRLVEAVANVETSLSFYERLDNARGAAAALVNYGNILFEGLDDYGRAYEVFRKAVAMLESSGPRALGATALGNLAEIEYAMGEHDAAVDHAQRAIERFEERSSAAMIAWQYETLARIALARGYLALATQQLLFASNLLRRAPQPLYVARLAELVARRLFFAGNLHAAALVFAAARRLRSECGLVAQGLFAREVRSDETALGERLSPAELAQAAKTAAGWDLGRICTILAELLAAG